METLAACPQLTNIQAVGDSEKTPQNPSLLPYPENHRRFKECWRNASGSKEHFCLTQSNCEDFS